MGKTDGIDTRTDAAKAENTAGVEFELINSPFNRSNVEQSDARGTYIEEGIFLGPSKDTPELHEIRCGASPDCRCIGDGKWCFKPTELEVATPNPRWVFVPEAPVLIQCTRNNDGSCQWNALGAPDRFSAHTRTPTVIRAMALTSSRSIGIRIGCLARYYP
jgi:hypothetical protein